MSNNQSSVEWLYFELKQFEYGLSEFTSKTAIRNYADTKYKQEQLQFLLGYFKWHQEKGYVSHKTEDAVEYYKETFNETRDN